jgi:hypothetical protein
MISRFRTFIAGFSCCSAGVMVTVIVWVGTFIYTISPDSAIGRVLISIGFFEFPHRRLCARRGLSWSGWFICLGSVNPSESQVRSDRLADAAYPFVGNLYV